MHSQLCLDPLGDLKSFQHQLLCLGVGAGAYALGVRLWTLAVPPCAMLGDLGLLGFGHGEGFQNVAPRCRTCFCHRSLCDKMMVSAGPCPNRPFPPSEVGKLECMWGSTAYRSFPAADLRFGEKMKVAKSAAGCDMRRKRRIGARSEELLAKALSAVSRPTVGLDTADPVRSDRQMMPMGRWGDGEKDLC